MIEEENELLLYNLSCYLIWVQGRKLSVVDSLGQFIESVYEVSGAGAACLSLLLD